MFRRQNGRLGDRWDVRSREASIPDHARVLGLGDGCFSVMWRGLEDQVRGR